MRKIFVDQVDPKTATTLTLGTSGDTISIPSGVTFTQSGTMNASAITAGTLAVARGGTGAATFAAAGLSNAPAFLVQKSAAQAIANNTTTKVTFDTEILDTDNTFASDKFTPGVAGKYQIFAQVGISNMDDAKYNQVLLYKNGSSLNSRPMTIIVGANTQDSYSRFTYIVDSNDTDYFEVYVRHDNGNSRDLTYYQQTNFGGMKIIT